MTRVTDTVALDFTSVGIPRSLAWQQKLFLVSDVPTRLEITTAAHDALTHPPAYRTGWRFQATAADNETLVFDVACDIGDRWILLDVYS